MGEIRMFAGNFAPVGWFLCQGQTLSIAQFEVLFILIGTTYGGDGQNTFNLPDLQGRFPIHQGTGPGLSTYVLGQEAGVEAVTLTQQQIGAHTHLVGASSAAGNSNSPANAVFATATTNIYGPPSPATVMNPNTVSPAGGNQPHDNMQPFLCINFIIAWQGIFPSQS